MNPKYRNVTGIVLLIVFLGLLGWDIVLATDKIEGNTISEVLGELAVAGWLIAFLMGHWWPLQRVLARIWSKDLSALSVSQLKDMRIEIDRQLGAKERGHRVG